MGRAFFPFLPAVGASEIKPVVRRQGDIIALIVDTGATGEKNILKCNIRIGYFGGGQSDMTTRLIAPGG